MSSVCGVPTIMFVPSTIWLCNIWKRYINPEDPNLPENQINLVFELDDRDEDDDFS
jgi:hypothetical protein